MIVNFKGWKPLRMGIMVQATLERNRAYEEITMIIVNCHSYR